MPSRMIHYLIAERVAEQLPIEDINRFRIGSLCPDMSCHEDGTKRKTHFVEFTEEQKGMNWCSFAQKYGERMRTDSLYLGVFCHIITDSIWFHDIVEVRIRSRISDRAKRQKKYREGYWDYHRLNDILVKEFSLRYAVEEDRNIELDGICPELYDSVFGGLYRDFTAEKPAAKEELTVYPYEAVISCIEKCIAMCVKGITAFRTGTALPAAGAYFVPIRD